MRACVHACLAVTCHLHFWQNNQGLLVLRATRDNVEADESYFDWIRLQSIGPWRSQRRARIYIYWLIDWWSLLYSVIAALLLHVSNTQQIPRVRAESWHWRRKLSRRSCRDSNPRPFDHESGALTTELSPLHYTVKHFHGPNPARLRESFFVLLLLFILSSKEHIILLVCIALDTLDQKLLYYMFRSSLFGLFAVWSLCNIIWHVQMSKVSPQLNQISLEFRCVIMSQHNENTK